MRLTCCCRVLPRFASDERVQHELERVLEGVNRPETGGLAIGQSGAATESRAGAD